MDFQQILNLLKGNLGGAGMQQVEDGSMVASGYDDLPQAQVPPKIDFQTLLRSLLGK